jgi:glycosyltransferase involved in cell wall biosynthesis
VSDYSAALITQLNPTYAIDLYHEPGYIPDLALGSADFKSYDARLFPRYAPVKDYHAIIYQMGNSSYHYFMYRYMLKHPGLVTLHDCCLAHFQLGYASRCGMDRDRIRDELVRGYPADSDEIRSCLKRWRWDLEVMARGCAQRGWYWNQPVIESALRLVVHSPWCRERVRDTMPDHADRVEVIPLGTRLLNRSAQERVAIRRRFGIAHDALVVSSLGFLHPWKLNREALDAFGAVAEADPSAVYVFAGEAPGDEMRRYVEERRVGDRVRFLGRQSAVDFADLTAVTDLGINLRLPPTFGETSAALLNLLGAGVATIVTDTGSFSDFPDSVVRKVRWESGGIERLRCALLELARDRGAREALGRAASAYVREYHEWPRVAERYVPVIERCHADRTAVKQTVQTPDLRSRA